MRADQIELTVSRRLQRFERSLLLSPLALMFSGVAHGVTPVISWADSYSTAGQCYCATTFDHEAADISVQTPQGIFTTSQICERIGPGPGIGSNPVYNDLQCGHGPPNNAIDEVLCPGRVDQGEAGCFILGPTWNLDVWFPAPEPTRHAGRPASEVDAELGASSTTVLAFEAEQASAIDARWVVVDSLLASQGSEGDSDPGHASTASDGRYLELLPDERRAPGDPSSTADAWQTPGVGPRLEIDLDFPEAGRWEVYARAYSTGSEDDRVFVALDGDFSTAAILDLCDQRDVWVWSKCHGDNEPAVSVPSPGIHTVQLAGLDDGFELDRVMLARVDAVEPPVEPPVEPEAPAEEGIESSETTGEETAAPELGAAVTVGSEVAAIDYRLLLLLVGSLLARTKLARRA